MHEMVLASKKSTYIDGRKHDEVIKYRKKFLRRMVALGFLNASNASTEEAKQTLPD